MMSLAEKIGVANTIAAYLDGTAIDLAAELRERGLGELAADDEFSRLFSDRCWKCPDCGSWNADDGQWADGHPPCPDCEDDDFDWDEGE